MHRQQNHKVKLQPALTQQRTHMKAGHGKVERFRFFGEVGTCELEVVFCIVELLLTILPHALEQPLSCHWKPVLLPAKAVESGPIVPPCRRRRRTGTRHSSFRHYYPFQESFSGYNSDASLQTVTQATFTRPSQQKLHRLTFFNCASARTEPT